MNSQLLLSSLQSYVDKRKISVDQLSPEEMIRTMVDWYRTERVALAAADSSQDTLIYRYGGWSEGCATGFKLSLLRRIRTRDDNGQADWMAGMTMMFDPSRFSAVVPFSTQASDWQTLDAFVRAIESSAGYRAVKQDSPVGALLEVGGLR